MSVKLTLSLCQDFRHYTSLETACYMSEINMSPVMNIWYGHVKLMMVILTWSWF